MLSIAWSWSKLFGFNNMHIPLAGVLPKGYGQELKKPEGCKASENC